MKPDDVVLHQDNTTIRLFRGRDLPEGQTGDYLTVAYPDGRAEEVMVWMADARRRVGQLVISEVTHVPERYIANVVGRQVLQEIEGAEAERLLALYDRSNLRSFRGEVS